MIRKIAKLACLSALLSGMAQAESYDFQVLCNGSPVGSHQVETTKIDGGTDVKVDIALDVTVAGILVYRYRHHSHEKWQGDQLLSLESETDDDGTPLHVTAKATGDGHIAVESSDGNKIVPATIVPTSYWNPLLVERSELLDSQSGKIMKVSTKKLPEDHYQMTGDLRLLLDYSGGKWSGLHFSYFGADFDYQPRPQLSAHLP
jgi:hypothetical protein